MSFRDSACRTSVDVSEDSARRDWTPVGKAFAWVSLGCVAAGVLVGAVWAVIAPRTELVIKGGEVAYVRLSEAAVGADLTFGCLAIACGLVTGTAIALRHRSGGLEVLIIGASGGLLGSLIAWKVGLAIAGGDSDTGVISIAGRPEGTVFQGPLELNSPGVLGLWSMFAVAVLTLVSWRRGVAASRRMDAIAQEGARLEASAG